MPKFGSRRQFSVEAFTYLQQIPHLNSYSQNCTILFCPFARKFVLLRGITKVIFLKPSVPAVAQTEFPQSHEWSLCVFNAGGSFVQRSQGTNFFCSQCVWYCTGFGLNCPKPFSVTSQVDETATSGSQTHILCVRASYGVGTSAAQHPAFQSTCYSPRGSFWGTGLHPDQVFRGWVPPICRFWNKLICAITQQLC